MANVVYVHGSNDTIKWAAEPATRGTLNILSTCIITLSLCVWSSVHLNLPGNGQSYWANFVRRLAWLAGALVAPEYLILTAWSQRQTAKRTLKEVKEAFDSKLKATVKHADPQLNYHVLTTVDQDGDAEQQPQPLSRQYPWTMTHSFWAIMGGISIDSKDSEPFIPDSQRSTLTANGVSLLLKHEPQLLPDISEEEVKDKSKESSLTKLLAFVQAAWFCLSCMVRISQKLPVSLLELNTFAHALCTLIVYVLWWKKPLNIEQPLLIYEDRIRPLLAYMWMASKTSCIPKPKNSGNVTIDVGRDPEFEAIIDERTSGAATATGNETPNAVQSELWSDALPVLDSSTEALDGTHRSSFRVTTSQALPGTGFKANGNSTRWKVTTTYGVGSDEFSEVYSNICYRPAVFNLTPCDVRRWRFAREAMDKYQLQKPDENLYLVTIKPVTEHMENSKGSDRMLATWHLLGISLVSAAYGALHAVAWNAHFPSHREKVLWRVSALVIAGPAVLCVIPMLLYYAAMAARFGFQSCSIKLSPAAKLQQTLSCKPPVVVFAKRAAESTMSILRIVGEIFAPSALIFFYFPARVYLVYESFRIVFFLPPEAFKATWTQYIPHIT